MQRVKFLIIGSGPTGLGTGYRLKELGENNFQILERNNYIGGLASSFLDAKGFTWDIGGHVQFSHYPYFDEAMRRAIETSKWLHHQRESWVWIHNKFVPYPFQNNIGFLPKDAMWKCLKGLIEIATSPKADKPRNFGEWIQASFGSGVAEEFMDPYNFKVWAYPTQELSYGWIGDRVATVDLKRIVENILYEKMDASWGPNNTFQFPEKGGTGAIWNSIASIVGLDKIRLNTTVVSIDPSTRQAFLADGTTIAYEHLLSTMPLDIFSKMVKGVPTALSDHAQGLRHSSSNIIGIGVKGKPKPDLKTKCWMYFPEGNTPFYRVTMFSNYSPNNVPSADYYSFMCEVSESPVKSVDRSALIRDTEQGLKNIGFLNDSDEVASRWTFSADYGYPTPSVERDSILAEVIPQLDKLEAYSRGRFGGWKYEVSNQDHSFMQGVEWVNRITSNEAEKTYRVDDTKDPNMTILKGQTAATQKAA